jgi:hypothetical protein
VKEPETNISRTLAVTGNAAVTTTSAVELSPAVQIDADFYGWLHDQASTLRHLRPRALDWQNLAEELEAMSRSEENALESYLVALLLNPTQDSYNDFLAARLCVIPARVSGAREESRNQ